MYWGDSCFTRTSARCAVLNLEREAKARAYTDEKEREGGSRAKSEKEFFIDAHIVRIHFVTEAIQ